MSVQEKILATESEAADLLSCSQKTVYNLRKAGELPFVMVRSRPMYRIATLQEVIASKEQTAK